MKSKSSTIEIRPFQLETIFLVMFGLIFVVGGIFVYATGLVAPVIREVGPLLVLVAVALLMLLGALMIYWGVRAIRNPSVTLRLSPEGLWIAKHKLEIPWEQILRAEVIDPRHRKSENENLTEDVMSIALRGRTQRILLAVITLTKAGRKALGGKDYIGWYFRRNLRLEEDLVLLPYFFPHGEMANLTEEIQRRASAAREAKRASRYAPED